MCCTSLEIREGGISEPDPAKNSVYCSGSSLASWEFVPSAFKGSNKHTLDKAPGGNGEDKIKLSPVPNVTSGTHKQMQDTVPWSRNEVASALPGGGEEVFSE